MNSLLKTQVTSRVDQERRPEPYTIAIWSVYLSNSPVSRWAVPFHPGFSVTLVSLSLFLVSLHSHHEQSFSFMSCPAWHCSCVAWQCANRDRSTQVQKTCRRSSKTGTSPPFYLLPSWEGRCVALSLGGMEAREADFALGLHPGSLFQATWNWLQALHTHQRKIKR